MKLRDNPFYILNLNCTAGTEAVTQAAGNSDRRKADAAAVLLDPCLRLEAELGWFCDADNMRLEKIKGALASGTAIDTKYLLPLSALNAELYNVLELGAQLPPDVNPIYNICVLYEGLSLKYLLQLINGRRQSGGIEPANPDQLQQALNALRNEICGKILERFPNPSQLRYMAENASEAYKNGGKGGELSVALRLLAQLSPGNAAQPAPGPVPQPTPGPVPQPAPGPAADKKAAQEALKAEKAAAKAAQNAEKAAAKAAQNAEKAAAKAAQNAEKAAAKAEQKALKDALKAERAAEPKKKSKAPIIVSSVVLALALIAGGSFLYLHLTDPVYKLNKQLDEIGDVTYEDGPAIAEARAAYNALSPEDRTEFTREGDISDFEALYFNEEIKKDISDYKNNFDWLKGKYIALKKLSDEQEKLVTRKDQLLGQINSCYLVKESEIQKKARGLFNEEKYLEAYREITEYQDYLDSSFVEEEDRENLTALQISEKTQKQAYDAGLQYARVLFESGQLSKTDKMLDELLDKNYYGLNLSEIEEIRENVDKIAKKNLPRNGKIFNNSFRGGRGELIIKTEDKAAFVKLYPLSDSENVLSFFVRPNEEFKLNIMDGVYGIMYATGDKWYSEEEYFGEDGEYYDGQIIIMYNTTNDARYIYYQAYNIGCYPALDGVEWKPIEREVFFYGIEES